MKNRKQIPQTFRQKCFRLKDGEVQAYRSGHFLALAWRAPSKKKGIIMLTSKDSANVISVIRGGSGIQKMVRPGSGCGHPVLCVTRC